MPISYFDVAKIGNNSETAKLFVDKFTKYTKNSAGWEMPICGANELKP